MSDETSGWLYQWDATIQKERDVGDGFIVEYSPDDIKKFMRKYCNKKKWCFQLEKGKESGYLHYQCRFSLNDKLPMSAKKNGKSLIKAFNDEGIFGMHLSPTNVKCKDMQYVVKSDTRVDGPWTSEDDNKFIPKHLRGIKLYPFQDSIVQLSKIVHPRFIDIILQGPGGIGKSVICDYMEVHGLGITLPSINDYQDILAIAMAEVKAFEEFREYDPDRDFTFLIDLPKASNKTELHKTFAALETLKDGKGFDKRYGYKKMRTNRTVLIVFTNELPDLNWLSRDRWRIWNINDKKELVKWEKESTPLEMVRCEKTEVVKLNMDLLKIPKRNLGGPIPAQITPPKEELVKKEGENDLHNKLCHKELQTEIKKTVSKLPHEKY